ncbi:MAG: hypothetical protein HOV81_09295 [Kofleriaceae bacterium]|nr:hypothetical protein [Kofleriaceae bacterium]
MVKTKGKSPKGKAAPRKAVKAAKPAKAAKIAKPAKAPKIAKPTKLPAVAVKPAKPTKPSLPPPPAPALPPPQRDELAAPRDIARLTRYGERFGANRIDVRWPSIQLPIAAHAIALFDPGVPKSWRVLDRPVGTGQFKPMLSIARTDDGKEKLAALTIHTGRPPIARWTVAHHKGGKKPKSADQLPVISVTTGWLALVDGTDSPGPVALPAAQGITPVEVPLTDGRKVLALPCPNGEYTCYWAVDGADKPICLVVDFDVFTQKDWKTRPPA